MPKLTLEDAISKRRSHREFDDRPLPLAIIHRLLWAAQGVTAPDGRRTVPSAHALHPLHLRIIAGNVTELSPGLYSASPDMRAIDPILQTDIREELERAALDHQPWIAKAACIITICADMVAVSNAFAEQPPYGLRGRRYACIEAGAAAQNMQLEATIENLASVLVAGFRDEATAEVLRLETPIEPILHLCVGWPADN